MDMDPSKIKHAIVTIITPNHFRFALALQQSLRRHNGFTFDFYCFLASDENIESIYSQVNFDLEEIKIITPFEINTNFSREIHDKYYHDNKDCYRWSMKPVVLNYLIEYRGYQKVIYADSDLYFYESIDFIFEELDRNRVLLSPHWRCSIDPKADWFNFTLNFMHGIYNGGFIAINQHACEVMKYWANLCYHACEQNLNLGLHDDQRYLDIFQSVFDGIGVIRHMGCNISNWNQLECKRSIDDNGKVTINHKYPIVFIHFTSGTITEIVKGHDKYLHSHYIVYCHHLKQLDPSYDLEQVATHLLKLESERYGNANFPNPTYSMYDKIKKYLTVWFKN